MRYKDALELSEEYNDELKADDPRFRQSVVINHIDGSYFHYDSAFLMKKDEYIFLFAEHYPPMVFDKDDLESYRQYKTVYSEIECL